MNFKFEDLIRNNKSKKVLKKFKKDKAEYKDKKEKSYCCPSK